MSEMIYTSFKPDPILKPYIENFWQINGFISTTECITLLPNGGISLLLNLGEEIFSHRFSGKISNNNIYIVGPMKKQDVHELSGELRIFGINFKPGGFPHFYKYGSIASITDQFQDFRKRDFPDVKKMLTNFVPHLNQFFINKLVPGNNSVLTITEDISSNSQIQNISDLTKKYFITERGLERLFKNQIGLSPKEFTNLHRFKIALSKIESRVSQSLSTIAWESGYYDHAHMTNDFKKYTGKSPNDYILSDFSKTIALEPL